MRDAKWGRRFLVIRLFLSGWIMCAGNLDDIADILRGFSAMQNHISHK